MHEPVRVKAAPFARITLAGGALAMALAVGAGAFAAHAGRSLPHPEAAELLQAAVLYHFVDGLALVAVGILARFGTSRWLLVAALLFALGLVLFCGSLWAMALTGGEATLAAPLGGFSLIGGWIALAIHGATR
jgi:uncharacterized membrane protein YgdD (TMEM256/DUF423 family)